MIRSVTTCCFFLAIILVAGNCSGNNSVRKWSKIWGSETNDYGYGVSVDSAGNCYVSGYTFGGFDGLTNSGKSDIFLTKYDSSGSNLWTRLWGTDTYEYSWAVSVDSNDNCYIGGFTNGEFDGQTNAGQMDICLTKHNSSGTKLWTRIWGSDRSDKCFDVSVDTIGNCYVTGWTYGEFDGQTNAGGWDMFLTKCNSSGSNLWTRIWGSTAKDYGQAVSMDSIGNCYVAGHTFGEFDGQTNAGKLDICLTKYNSSGVKQWSKIWGSIEDDHCQSVTVDSAGNCYVAGFTLGEFDGQPDLGSVDSFLTKYNSSGIKQWTRLWGSWSYDAGRGVSVDSFGNCYVAGITAGEFDNQTNTGSGDIFLTKYNSSGTKLWSEIWGSTRMDRGRDISVDSYGNCYITGYTEGEFDGQTNAGSIDIFLSKFAPLPLVDITNSNYSVELPKTTATIAGTNNEFIAIGSTMWWENTSTSGVSGTFLADSSKSWNFSGIELTPVVNIITVSGSNIFGDISTDSITINLVPESGIILLTMSAALWLLRNRH